MENELSQQNVIATGDPAISDVDILSQPDALRAIDVMRKHGWLSISMKSFDKVLGQDPTHPAYARLKEEARFGGKTGLLLYAILSGFFGMLFLITIMHQGMPATVFVMWIALAIAGGLVWRNHPGLFAAGGLKKMMEDRE